MPEETVLTMRTAQKEQLIRSLGSLAAGNISLVDAAASLDYLRESSFAKEEQASITLAINAAVNNRDSDAGGAVVQASPRVTLKPQEMLHPQRYFTAKDWESLRNPALSLQSRLDVVVRRCSSIGLISTSEKTAAALTAVVIVARGAQCDSNDCFDALLSLKNALKQMRLHRASSVKQSCLRFPADPADFTKLYPDSYEEPPVACPIDESSITCLRDGMPCRRTHSSVRTSSLALALPNTQMKRGASQLDSLLAPLAQALACQMQEKHSQNRPSCNLDFLGTPPPKRLQPTEDDSQEDGHASTPALASPLALGAPPTPGLPALKDGSVAEKSEVAEGPKPEGIGDVVAAVQAALAAKAASAAEKRAAAADTEGDGAAEAEPIGKGKAKGKAKSKAKGKAKSKAKGKASASPKGKGEASPKAASSPPQPKHGKHAPIKWLSCTIYADCSGKAWRAIESSNRRHDVKFKWSKEDSWERCLAWCREAAKAATTV